MTLSKADLLKLGSRKVAGVEVPGGVVYARGLTAAEWDEYEDASTVAATGRTRSNRVTLFRLAACDEAGKPLFTAADEPTIRDLPTEIVNPVCAKCYELSGVTKKAADDAGKGSPAP